MSHRDVVTLPGPGGSSVSCCILPCGCVLLLLAGLLVGGVGLGLRLHQRPSVARAAPSVAAPRRAALLVLPAR